MSSVVIIDDHKIVRAGIKSALAIHEGIVVVGEAGDAIQAKEVLSAVRPDIVILDISMPQISGLDFIKYIKLNYPKIKVIIFTMHEDPEYLNAAIERGAEGYLLKNADLNEIAKAIQTVNEGKCFYSEQLSNCFANVIRDTKNNNESEQIVKKLTPREFEVLEQIVAGQSNKMISAILKISVKTVAIHRTNIMKKMSAKNVADLVRMAVMNNILA